MTEPRRSTSSAPPAAKNCVGDEHEDAAPGELLARERSARADAERALRSRDELLATVSHDLRDPLSVILAGVQLVRQTLEAEGPSERAHGQIARIERSAQRMSVLIDDLLDISAIESGHLSVEIGAQDAASLIADCVDLLRPAAQAKSLVITIVDATGGARVCCDRDRIAQVFGNLVGNAIKFTTPGGSITIRAAAADHEVCFSVSDTGPGIAADQVPRVFDRFWKAAHTPRSGTGLGLAICRGIVERHGGRIWVESRLGEGTKFNFTLPTVRPDGECSHPT